MSWVWCLPGSEWGQRPRDSRVGAHPLMGEAGFSAGSLVGEVRYLGTQSSLISLLLMGLMLAQPGMGRALVLWCTESSLYLFNILLEIPTKESKRHSYWKRRKPSLSAEDRALHAEYQY